MATIHVEKCSTSTVFSHGYVAAMVFSHGTLHKSQVSTFKHVHVHQNFEHCTEATSTTFVNQKTYMPITITQLLNAISRHDIQYVAFALEADFPSNVNEFMTCAFACFK